MMTHAHALVYSEAVHEFLQEVGRLIDFSHKTLHECFVVRLPVDSLRWPSTAVFPERDWGSVALQLKAGGTEVTAEIALTGQSATGQLCVQKNYWSIQDARASYEVYGAAMSIADVRTLLSYLIIEFRASTFNVSAKE